MTTRASAPLLTADTIRDRSRAKAEPEWLLKRRLDAWRAFEAMAMPSPLEEEWRRTDISALDVEAALASGGVKPAKLPAALTDPAGFAGTIIQSDGEIVSQAMMALPKGVIFTGLHTAARDHAKLIREHLHDIVHATDWKLGALQAAAWQGGAFVYVPRNTEVELPLRYVVSQTGSLTAPHLLIVAEENSGVSVIQETYSADGGAQALVTGAVEIVARADARVRFLEVQRWGHSVYNFSTVRAQQDRGSQVTAGLVGLGARLTKTKLETILEGEGATAELLGLSFGDEQQHFQYDTLQDHIGPHTDSDLLFKAALEDRSSEVWTGTVRIRKGASQASANQTSRNLLLSPKAKAAPIPVLEIEAYDVLKCSHGASAGPLDEEQRFYLESRGIPKVEAQRLLVEAFFQQVLDRMPAEAVRARLEKALAAKIEAGY
jgi:Fe-S cluster assembly protein SufD